MGSATSRDRLMELLEPVVEAEGLDLEDVTVTPAGKRRLLRVVVDRDGGVSLDDVAEVSRAVSEALDADDAMGATAVRAGGHLAGGRPPADRAAPLAARGRPAGQGRPARRHRRGGPGASPPTRPAWSWTSTAHRAGIDYQDLTRGRVQVEFRRLDDAETTAKTATKAKGEASWTST